MITPVKLSKEVTLVLEDGYENGQRTADVRLRLPHKSDYANEESVVRFVGKTVMIDMEVLKKFGFDIEVVKQPEREDIAKRTDIDEPDMERD